MSKHKLSGKALVIQITGDDIRVARMTLGGKDPRILDRIVLPVPDGTVEDGELRNLDTLRALLDPVVKEKPYRGCRRVVFLLCSTKIISESVLVPEVKSERRLRQMLESNMDVYFPVASNEYQMTWKAAGLEEDGGLDMLRVQLWAVPQQMINRYYLLANSMDLTVAAVDFFGHSLVNAVDASYYTLHGRRKKKDTAQEEEIIQLYIHAEDGLLLLTSVRNGQVAAQRFLLRGSSLQEDLNELEMLLDYFSITPGTPGLEEAFISGSNFGEEGLASGISELLGVPVQPILCDDGPEWLLFQGAAMTELDFGDQKMNHLTGKNRPIQRGWQYGLVLVGGLAFVVSTLFTMNAKLGWNTQLNALQSNLTQLKILSAQNDGSGERYNEYSNLYDDYSKDWDVIFDSVRTYNDNLERILGSLETALPKDATVKKMSIADQGIAVQVAFQDKEDIAYFLLALRHEPYMNLMAVSNLRVGPTEEGDEGEPSAMLELVYGPTEEQDGTEEDTAEGDASGDLDSNQENTNQTGLNRDMLNALTGNTDTGSYEAPPTEGSYSLEALLPSGTTSADVSQALSMAMALSGKDTLDGATLRQMLPYLSMMGVSSDVVAKVTAAAAMMESTGMTVSVSDIISSQLSSGTSGSGGNTLSGMGINDPDWKVYLYSPDDTGSSSGTSSSSGSSSGTASIGTVPTLDEMELALQYLDADQLDALQEVYGPEQEKTFSLPSLFRSASDTQEKNAITSLLGNDISAMYKFFILMQRDIERDDDDKILTDLIWDDIYENPDMHRMFYESDQELLEAYLPDLVKLLTKNEKNLTATEKLIQTDDGLSDKLAIHLAKELKKIDDADTDLDLIALRKAYQNEDYLDEDRDVIRAVETLMKAVETAQGAAATDMGTGIDPRLLYLMMQMMQDQTGDKDTNIFGNGSNVQVVTDDRYYITFVLGYDESLIQAEQVRKGLDRDARVEKVEVAG